MRAGIYLRISQDRDGTSTATARQAEDCRKVAEARGWTIVDTFEDADVSAFSRTVIRPEFERMLDAVRARDLDVVLVWKLDRLARRIRDFARVDEECEAAGARIVTVVDAIDTGTSAGRVVASVMTAMARAESENISIRGARKAKEMAQQGRPTTGGTRPFGYSVDRMTICEPEAALIREAVSRVLDGDGIRTICRDWESRGVVAPRGAAWQASPLKRMLCSSLLSGQREHQGVLSPGCWPAILTPDDTTALRAILWAPARRLAVSNARKHLLSGFVRCGACGESLIARPDTKNQKVRYVCSRAPGKANCGKLARLAEPVDATVLEMMAVRLDGVSLTVEPASPEDDRRVLVGAVRADEARLEQLSIDHYRDGLIGRPEYFAARDGITARLEANREKLARLRGRNVLAGLDGGAALRAQWPDRPLEWRREVIATLIDHIVIEPAVKGDNRFNPALVRVVWKA